MPDMTAHHIPDAVVARSLAPAVFDAAIKAAWEYVMSLPEPDPYMNEHDPAALRSLMEAAGHPEGSVEHAVYEYAIGCGILGAIERLFPYEEGQYD